MGCALTILISSDFVGAHSCRPPLFQQAHGASPLSVSQQQYQQQHQQQQQQQYQQQTQQQPQPQSPELDALHYVVSSNSSAAVWVPAQQEIPSCTGESAFPTNEAMTAWCCADMLGVVQCQCWSVKTYSICYP